MNELGRIFKRGNVLWIVTKIDSLGGTTIVPLRDYILKVTRVELFQGEVLSLEDIMKESYDRFLIGKEITEEVELKTVENNALD